MIKNPVITVLTEAEYKEVQKSLQRLTELKIIKWEEDKKPKTLEAKISVALTYSSEYIGGFLLANVVSYKRGLRSMEGIGEVPLLELPWLKDRQLAICLNSKKDLNDFFKTLYAESYGEKEVSSIEDGCRKLAAKQ